MPDGDLIKRGIRYVWKAAYEGLGERAQPNVVASRMAKAVTRILRVSHGVDCLDAAAELVDDAHSGRISAQQAYAELRTLRSANPALRDIVAQAAARSLFAQQSPEGCRSELSVAVIHEIANVGLLSKATPALVQDGVAHDVADARGYVRECRDAAHRDFSRIAAQLATTPVGDGYRAPPHRRRTVSTAVLLNESIE